MSSPDQLRQELARCFSYDRRRIARMIDRAAELVRTGRPADRLLASQSGDSLVPFPVGAADGVLGVQSPLEGLLLVPQGLVAEAH